MVGLARCRMRLRRHASLALAILCASSLPWSCDLAKSLDPRTQEPILLLVLSDIASNPFQLELTALVANSGRPSRVEYRSAQTFRMTRESDGAGFAWRASSPPVFPGGGSFLPTAGNYALDEKSSASGLGREALMAGER